MSQPVASDSGSASRSLVAGVDVGGTKVAALVVDETGETLGRAVRPMAGRSDAGIEPIVMAVRAALDAAGADSLELAAIGVGVPGRVDAVAGIVRLATNLGWHDLPLARLIEGELGVPCLVENDVGLAASGLAGHPIASGAKSLAYVAVGTGIGAGLVLNGRLHRGDRGMAGEIGHVIVEPDGSVCRCGQRGCLETVASGPFIARRAADALAAGAPSAGAQSILRQAGTLTAKTVYEAAGAGDELARTIADEVGRTLARAVAGLMLTCDLDLVLLGGGVAAAGPAFLDPILAELERLRAASPLVAAMIPPGSVRALPPHFDPVAWGGVALAQSLVRAGFPAHPPGGSEEEVVARTSLA
jgi:glucokinase-like ROK family protein